MGCAGCAAAAAARQKALASSKRIELSSKIPKRGKPAKVKPQGERLETRKPELSTYERHLRAKRR